MSKKQETRAPVFDNTAAEERKARELYGANYKPVKAPLREKEKVAPAVTNCLSDAPTENRKSRKAGQLQSSILTHADESVREQRKGNYEAGGRIQSASNAGWNAQTGY